MRNRWLYLAATVPLLAAMPSLISACKARANDESVVRDDETVAKGSCDAAISADAKNVSSTSLAALVERAKNPACKAKILRLPLVRQTKGFTCGAASVKSILFYFGDFMAETELQRLLRSHKDNGTAFTRILRLFHALNEKSTREKIANMSGFDSHVELQDLELILKDPAVQAAIKAKASTSAAHASVVAGIEGLKSDALDIDKMGKLAATLNLIEEEGAETADNGRRVQRPPTKPKEPHQNKYSMKLFYGRKPYNPGGALPAGCPERPSPSVATQIENTRAMTIADLEKAIDAGSPVLALTQAWTYESDKDYDIGAYENGWASGHYVVVIGYDQKNIYYMDPYDMGHYAFLPKAEWEKRWHDYDGFLAGDMETRCPGGTELHQWGLVVSRAGGPAYEADRITKMY